MEASVNGAKGNEDDGFGDFIGAETMSGAAVTTVDSGSAQPGTPGELSQNTTVASVSEPPQAPSQVEGGQENLHEATPPPVPPSLSELEAGPTDAATNLQQTSPDTAIGNKPIIYEGLCSCTCTFTRTSYLFQSIPMHSFRYNRCKSVRVDR